VRELEQKCATDEAAGRRAAAEDESTVSLAGQLAPVTDGAAHRSGDEPMVLETLATSGRYPRASNVGKVMIDPAPTIVLIVPAARPAPAMARSASALTVLANLTSAWPEASRPRVD